jgi:hypothetical protein
MIAAVLLMLGSVFGGGLHLCHGSGEHLSPDDCVLCSCASAPALAVGHKPLTATVVVTRRAATPPAENPPRIFSSTPLACRAPPSATLA